MTVMERIDVGIVSNHREAIRKWKKNTNLKNKLRTRKGGRDVQSKNEKLELFVARDMKDWS